MHLAPVWSPSRPSLALTSPRLCPILPLPRPYLAPTKAISKCAPAPTPPTAQAALMAAMQDPLLAASIGGKPVTAMFPPAQARPPAGAGAGAARSLEGRVGGSTRAEIEALLSDDLLYQVSTLTALNKALANELKEARKQGAERAAKVRGMGGPAWITHISRILSPPYPPRG